MPYNRQEPRSLLLLEILRIRTKGSCLTFWTSISFSPRYTLQLGLTSVILRKYSTEKTRLCLLCSNLLRMCRRGVRKTSPKHPPLPCTTFGAFGACVSAFRVFSKTLRSKPSLIFRHLPLTAVGSVSPLEPGVVPRLDSLDSLCTHDRSLRSLSAAWVLEVASLQRARLRRDFPQHATSPTTQLLPLPSFSPKHATLFATQLLSRPPFFPQHATFSLRELPFFPQPANSPYVSLLSSNCTKFPNFRRYPLSSLPSPSPVSPLESLPIFKLQTTSATLHSTFPPHATFYTRISLKFPRDLRILDGGDFRGSTKWPFSGGPPGTAFFDPLFSSWLIAKSKWTKFRHSEWGFRNEWILLQLELRELQGSGRGKFRSRKYVCRDQISNRGDSTRDFFFTLIFQTWNASRRFPFEWPFLSYYFVVRYQIPEVLQTPSKFGPYKMAILGGPPWNGLFYPPFQ